MTAEQPSLDPQKYPWHRGDVVTFRFEKYGFVLDFTLEYLEVIWLQTSSIERVATEDVDRLLRVGHGASVSHDGSKTNLQLTETALSLHKLKKAAEERIASCKTEAERKSANQFISRAFASDGCEWDKVHHAQLMNLALQPWNVGVLFKMKERIHRLSCKKH